MSKLIYLASPYSDPSHDVKVMRFEAVCRVAFNLIKKTDNVFFVPIAMSHAIETEASDVKGLILSLPHEKWMQQDLAILKRCDELMVVCLPGWKTSKGVTEEIAFAKEHNIPITYLKRGVSIC